MKQTDKKTVLLAMSGGVDSAAAAVLLKEAGYEVVGATMLLWHEQNQEEQARALAEKSSRLAARLGIRHLLIDLSEDFFSRVVRPFIQAYQEGLTPNPCVLCNREIKFSRLFELAEARMRETEASEPERQPFDYFATGHYARLRHDMELDEYQLIRAVDEKKDQSYMLYVLDQALLRRLILPLGELRKDEVRAIARRAGLEIPAEEESQDICFISGHYRDLLAGWGGFGKSGFFVDMAGSELAAHEGVARYTVGQRKGLGRGFGKALHVISLDGKSGRVVLGEEAALYRHELLLEKPSFNLRRPPVFPMLVDVATRYHQEPKPAILEESGDRSAPLILRSENPQRASCPGQSAVFYLGDRVIGGAIISRERFGI